MEAILNICQLIHKDDYLTSIDLQDAFLHVVVRHSSRKYLRFHWKE